MTCTMSEQEPVTAETGTEPRRRKKPKRTARRIAQLAQAQAIAKQRHKELKAAEAEAEARGFTAAPGTTRAVPANVTRAPDAASAQLARTSTPGSNATKVHVYRINPQTGGEAYVTSLSPDAFTEEWLATQCGGGRYIARFMISTEKGWKFVRDQVLEIDPAIPTRLPGQFTTASSTAAAANPAQPSIADSAVLAIIQQGQAMASQQAQITAAMIKDMGARSTFDPTTWIQALAPIVAPIVASVMNRKDPIELAAKLAEMRQPAGPTAQLSEVLSLAERLARRTGGRDAPRDGGGDRGDGFFNRILDVLPTFMQMQQQNAVRAAQQAEAAAARRQLAAPAAEAPTSVVPENAGPVAEAASAPLETPTLTAGGPAPIADDPKVLPFPSPSMPDTFDLKAVLGFLTPLVLPLAKDDRDPAIYAPPLLDQYASSPEIEKAFLAFAKSDTAVADIVASEPQFVGHESWLKDFLAESVKFLEESPAEGEDA
jgi:hypothetical protein